MKICPEMAAWEQMAAGALEASRVAALSKHLEQCPSCSSVHEKLSGNQAFIAPLREALREVRFPLPAPNAPYIPPREFHDGKPVRQFGRYRLIRPVGEGGMGTVWLAEQDHPRRQVALKVLKGGSLSPELRRRFDIETSLLGRLQHPGVARIYEAGTVETDMGNEPFFAMEYVCGHPLTDFADHAQLDIQQRVELLIQIAEAVQHAHQKGVIHRDLKPANIVVDETGLPKVLDFGVARTIGRDSANGQARTITGQLIGTIGYMSPEQCLGDQEAIDIRSDIYALGVIGYELLAGRRPHDLDDLSVFEAARIIREQDPTPLGTIHRTCRGDLETIIAKAMQKDRTRRYASAAGFAADLQRYLRDEPISARPASFIYQFAKFARRRRALALALIVLVLGTFATSLAGWVLAEKGRVRAEQAKSLQKGQTIKYYLDLISSLDRDDRIQLLQRGGGEAIADAFPHDLDTQSGIHESMARSYEAMGLHDEAAEQLSRSLQLRREHFGEMHGDTMRTANMLGDVLQAAGRLAEAEQLARDWKAASERTLGTNHEDTLRFSANLADVLRARGDFRGAATLYRSVVIAQTQIGHMDAAETGVSLARTLLQQSEQLEGAERIKVAKQAGQVASDAYQLALDNASQGADNPTTLRAMSTIGWAYLNTGKPTEAASLLERTSKRMDNALGVNHDYAIETLEYLARLRRQEGLHPDAEEIELKIDARRQKLAAEADRSYRN